MPSTLAESRNLFYKEKTYILWFWVTAGIVLSIDLFWFFPTTRAFTIVKFLEHIFLQNAFSPLEILHQVVITFMICLVWTSRDEGSFQGFELFRKGFLILLFLVFIEELAWGHNFVDYPWPDAIAPFMGRHEDVHNVMIGGADISDLLEALAAVFACTLLARSRNLKLPFVPVFPLTKSAFKMLRFAFFLSPLSMIKEVNEQDLIFETAIFSALSMGMMAGMGKLKTVAHDWEDSSAYHRMILWILLPLPWIKFVYLVLYGHYEMFPGH